MVGALQTVVFWQSAVGEMIVFLWYAVGVLDVGREGLGASSILVCAEPLGREFVGRCVWRSAHRHMYVISQPQNHSLSRCKEHGRHEHCSTKFESSIMV